MEDSLFFLEFRNPKETADDGESLSWMDFTNPMGKIEVGVGGSGARSMGKAWLACCFEGQYSREDTRADGANRGGHVKTSRYHQGGRRAEDLS